MKSRKYLIVLLHIAAWTLVYFLPELIFEAPSGEIFFFKRNLHFILAVMFFYLNYFVFVPKLLLCKKQWIYAFVVVASLFFTYFVNDITMHYVRQELSITHNNNSLEQTPKLKKRIARHHQAENTGTVVVVLIVFFLSTIMRETSELYKQERKRKDMEKEKLVSELSFLKSQVNPHFLFNSLNGIYALAMKKSDITPTAVLQLSDLMRHMLYESEKESIDLEKEIKYLENYIDLQRLRLPKDANIEFNVNGKIKGKQIEPMLFIPFIENAFKHGVVSHGVDIRINIDIKDNVLNMEVTNKISTAKSKDSVSGVGLTNVKKRLDLLYENNYKLDFDKANGVFVVNLKLNLKQ